MQILITKLALIVGLVALSASCGSTDSSSPIGGGDDGTGTIVERTLRWTPPVENVDNSAIAVNELTHYRIYYGINQSNLSDYIEISAVDHPSSYTVAYEDNLIVRSNTYYIAMTAINSLGLESARSEVLTLTLQ